MDERDNYQSWHENKEHEWESRCTHCGACCGALQDPCENLLSSEDGKFACRIYDNRFGPHRTVSGLEFDCVPIRWKIGVSWLGDERCGYKKPPQPQEPG